MTWVRPPVGQSFIEHALLKYPNPLPDYDALANAPAGRDTDDAIHRQILNRFDHESVVPFYSTHIECIWPLVERYRVSVGPWAGGPGGWIAIVHSVTHHPVASALAPAAPLAICRALLVAHAREVLP